MNKIELNKYIESISSQIPLIHSFYTDDVYEAWNTDEVRYGSLSFCITSSSVNDSTTIWNATVYYADRLLEDKSNRDAIQTDSINIITSIMNVVAMDEDIVSINYPTQVELFEQKFVDYLAGGYATMHIETQNSVSKCGYGYVKESVGCEGAINELESEIRDLNNVISEKDEVIASKNDIISSKDDEINRLEEQLDEAAENADLSLFSQIGYTEENASHYFNYLDEGLAFAKEIADNWDNRGTQYNWDLYKNEKLTYFPMIDFSSITSTQNMFSKTSGNIGCPRLITMPQLDTSNVTNMNSMFANCESLQEIPLLNTSKVTNMENMFLYCSSLTTIPHFDTSKVTNMNYMFQYCKNIKEIPLLDTSKVMSMNHMFSGSAADKMIIETIPHFDTSNVTNMSHMFSYCIYLKEIPLLDTSKVTNMYSMFENCESLVTIPPLDTSKVTDMTSMFSGCKSLVSLPVIDFSGYDRTKTNNFGAFFGYSNITSLTDLGGFKNFAQNWTSYGLSYLPNLTKQSLLNVLNYLDDVNDLGGRKLQLGTSHLAKLTDEEKQIATNKGWTLS